MASENGCPKVSYATKRLAQEVKNNRLASKNKRHRPKFLRVYHCPTCNQWHLTNETLR